MVDTGAGNDWVRALPAELDGQRRLLTGLVAICERDDAVRWLVIGCSLSRGAGDRLSDLDVGMGVTDDRIDATIPRIRHAVDGLGDLVDSYHHLLGSVSGSHERIFAQYADRCQIDLVVLPASADAGAIRDVVVLYDPDGLVNVREERQAVAPGQAREWAFTAWCALADLGKYLRRGSVWEAHDRLGQARAEYWKLRALAARVPDPQYGITSILDFAAGTVAASATATVSDLDPGRLLAAARRLAGLLAAVGDDLPEQHRAALPAAMAAFVTADLAADDLAAAGRGG
ncbi:MAG: hypothetical protein M0030_27065 [Actinomycetota bacterium]|nr:hypothetical protein [Actinomycetota bacterium]